MPADWRPSVTAAPKSLTSAGSAPNDRGPITGLSGLLFTSSTGARSKLIPRALICRPTASPNSRARDSLPVAPRAMLLGGTAPKGTRVEVPPSWSAAISSGMPDVSVAWSCSAAERAAVWDAVSTFRAK
jgi:hypothetical protein